MTLLLLCLVLQPVPEDSVWALFDRVAHPYLKYQDLKEPSKEALVGMGGDAARVLVGRGRLGTQNARETHGLEDILTEIGEEAVPSLIAALDDTCGRAVRLAIHILGEIGDPGTAPRILEFLDDTFWKTRASAVEALGGIGEPSTLEEIVASADDPVELVRTEVAHALASFGSERVRRTLFRMLSDPVASVRYTAFTSLEALEDVPFTEISDALEGAEGFGRALCLRLLLRYRDRPRAKSILMGELRNPDWRLRVEAAEALRDFGLSFSDRREIERIRDREGNALVILALTQLLGTT